MKPSGSQGMVLAAQCLPPVVLSFLLLLSLHTGPAVQTALLVSLVVLAPLAVFVELAALIVAFSHWRTHQSRGAVNLVCAAVGLLTLLGTIFLVGMLFGGGGGV